MKDNYPLYKVFIGAVIIVVGIANLLMNPGNIKPSEMTLQQGVSILTAITNMLAGGFICAFELMNKGK